MALYNSLAGYKGHTNLSIHKEVLYYTRATIQNCYSVVTVRKEIVNCHRLATGCKEVVDEEIVHEQVVHEEVVQEAVHEEVVRKEVVHEELVRKELVHEEVVHKEFVHKEFVDRLDHSWSLRHMDQSCVHKDSDFVDIPLAVDEIDESRDHLQRDQCKEDIVVSLA
jgi:hypothetical protein